MPLNYLHGAEVIQIDNGPRPIQTVAMSVIGIVGTAPGASDAIFPLNTPVLVPGSRRMLADLGLTGTLPDAIRRIFHYAGAMVVVIRVAEAAGIDAQLSNVIGSSGLYSGVHGFLRANSALGVRPRLLLAPGFTTQRPANQANPVMTALVEVANKLRAMIYADAPSGSNADAFQWRTDFNSRRIYPWAPMVKIWDAATSTYIDRPLSPSVVGIQSWLDNNKGFWWSPSNKELTDIGGVSRPIEYRAGDASCEANLLNSQHLNTVIHEDGWRSWGNRVCETDPNWVFASSVRICDAIDDSMLAAARVWIDQPLVPALVTDIVESCNAYLRVLGREGAIIGGKAWVDADRNSSGELSLGQLHVQYDREPASPLERLTYEAMRNQTYYSRLIGDVMSELKQATRAVPGMSGSGG